MPDSERYVSREISNLPMVGAVKVSQTIYYNGGSSTMEREIVICPIWFMVLMGVTVAALIALVIRIVHKHRKKRVVI